MEKVIKQIEAAYDNKELLSEIDVQHAVQQALYWLDKGQIRVAEPDGDGWKVNIWVKKAISLYFPIQQMETIELGPFEFNDKIPLKKIMQNLA